MKNLILPSIFFLRRSIFFTLALVFALLTSTAAEPGAVIEQRTKIKLLTIGNSFSDNMIFFINELAQAGGKEIVVFNATKGGATLEQHVRALKKFETDPNAVEARFYQNRQDPRTENKRDFALPEALTSDQWDYVTIQQNSLESYKPESFQPFIPILIETIRKNAPQAKILVVETWSYREDAPAFKDGKIPGLTQQAMYEQIKANYDKIAAEYGLRVVPLGDAVQAARALPAFTFRLDPTFDYKNPPKGQEPKEGGLNNGWHWRQGKWELDFKHLNIAGRYLASATLYEILFKESVVANTFVPPEVSLTDAQALRQLAHDTVEQQKK